MKIAIIGGGASGISAAISIKRHNPNIDVTILERFDRIGKKVLATGNGKCNIGNINLDSSYYNDDFVNTLINNMPLNDYLSYLESLGIYLKCDSEGRLYPYSDSSKTVMDILLRNLLELKCEVIHNFNVTDVIKTNNGFKVTSEDKRTMFFNKVIFSYGSSAQTKEVRISKVLSMFGHTIKKTIPALVPLKVAERVKDLSGLRFKAKVDLYVNDKFKYSEVGEVLFKDEGIGGIVILNVSRYIDNTKSNKLVLNFINDLSFNIDSYIEKNKDLEIVNILEGIVHKALAHKLKGSVKEVSDIKKVLRNFTLNVTGDYGISFSQISKGGVETKEVNPTTFESLKIKDLYIIGEALNIDGACGGYNLYFALASGACLGKNLFTN